MNLKNLNVTELSAQEVQETEGGSWIIFAAIVIIAAIFATDGNNRTQTYVDGQRVGN